MGRALSSVSLRTLPVHTVWPPHVLAAILSCHNGPHAPLNREPAQTFPSFVRYCVTATRIVSYICKGKTLKLHFLFHYSPVDVKVGISFIAACVINP